MRNPERRVRIFSTIVIFSLFAVVIPAQTSTAYSVSQPKVGCYGPDLARYDSLDRAAAIHDAQVSSVLQEATLGLQNLAYYSIFETGYSLPPSCNISDLSVNVVFGANNSAGFAYYVVSENASTLAPIGLTVEQNPPTFGWGCTGSTCYTGNWAGYEVYANSGATAPVLQAVTTFNESEALYPPSGCPYWNGLCVVSSWTGLEDKHGASDNNLAQAGTAAACTGSGCTASYWAWYEMIHSSGNNYAINCTGSNNVVIHKGDSISAAVTNAAGTGGSNTTYTFDVYDNANGSYCLVGGQTYTQMPDPTIGVFVTENQADCNPNPPYGCASLAKFGTVQYGGSEILSGGNYNWIYAFTSKGYYYKDIMENAPVAHGVTCGAFTVNASPGGVSSSSVFDVTWKSSDYTPVYQTGC